MKRIFVNTALEKYRRGRIEEPIEELPDVADEEEEEGWGGMNIPSEVLFGFVEDLPERYRLVFNLYVLEDLPHKEIAKRLGITEGTSKSNLARAKEILKRKVLEYLENER